MMRLRTEEEMRVAECMGALADAVIMWGGIALGCVPAALVAVQAPGWVVGFTVLAVGAVFVTAFVGRAFYVRGLRHGRRVADAEGQLGRPLTAAERWELYA